jgi:hypothetical protein
MDPSDRQRDDAHMPRLTDLELETCARALGALAYHEGSSAEKISDPALRAPVQLRAQCAAALAERFETGANKAASVVSLDVADTRGSPQ